MAAVSSYFMPRVVLGNNTFEKWTYMVYPFLLSKDDFTARMSAK
jgi:hypothetical protein